MQIQSYPFLQHFIISEVQLPRRRMHPFPMSIPTQNLRSIYISLKLFFLITLYGDNDFHMERMKQKLTEEEEKGWGGSKVFSGKPAGFLNPDFFL